MSNILQLIVWNHCYQLLLRNYNSLILAPCKHDYYGGDSLQAEHQALYITLLHSLSVSFTVLLNC